MRFQPFAPCTLAAALIFSGFVAATPASAQLSSNMQQVLRSINSPQFAGGGARVGGGRRGGRGGGGGDWVDGGAGYTSNERGELARYDTATGERTVLMTADEMTPPGMDRPLQLVEHSADGRYFLFSGNGRPTMIRKTEFNYWVLDKTSHKWTQVTPAKAPDGSPSRSLYAKLSPDGSQVACVYSNNIYVQNSSGGPAIQLTQDGSLMVINGTSDWVDEEELSLASCFRWSPDGKQIVYLQFDQTGVPEFALINYTDQLYPVITKYPYPKAGQTNAAVRLGVVSGSGGPTTWAKIGGDPRNNYIARFDWADNSDDIIVQHLNRLQNTNSVLLITAKTGDARQMFEDRDDAWVDYYDEFTWLDHGQKLLFLSERDGWRHAYTFTRDGKGSLITHGSFDVISVLLADEAGGWLYYMASPDNATQRFLYRSRLDGSGEAERLTPASLPGTHNYNISPNGRWAFHSYSTFTDPGQSDLVSLPDHKVARVFQDNAALRDRVKPILDGRAELMQVDGGDGVKMDGWLIRPTHFDASKKYPLIVYVYGEPAATTVNDSWGGNTRLLLAGLADDGYLMGSFDNQGTPSPKGRDWRKAVYGFVGVKSSKQQANAVRSLAAMHPYVDLDRVGVYGWSGGGSMTLNLMFRSPDLYKVGVAGAPVSDQALYDSIYQERYCGLPDQNAEGYREGSPITYADGLQGKLLVIHGTGDDNVHFQGTQRLLNKLIDLNKQFSFMEYPNRRHGITGTHLETLRFGFFEQYLPAGGR